MGVRHSNLWSARKERDLSKRDEDSVEAEVQLELVDVTLLIDVELKEDEMAAIIVVTNGKNVFLMDGKSQVNGKMDT